MAATPTKDYFAKTGITTLLAKGLAECITQTAEEPVRFLGEYLLRHKKLESAQKSAKSSEPTAPVILGAGATSDQAKLDSAAKKKEAEEEADKVALEKAMECKTRKQVLDIFAENIAERTQATSAFFGLVRPFEDEPENDDQTEELLFECSTEPKQMDRTLTKGTGVTWDALVVEEVEEDPDNPAPPPPRKFVNIDDILVQTQYKDRVHFWTPRRVHGAFAAVALTFPTHMTEEALAAPLRDGWPNPPEPKPEPEEKEVDPEADPEEAPPAEDPEPEEEEIPDPPTQSCRMVICVESTGKLVDFSRRIDWLKGQAEGIEAALAEADKWEFAKHRAAQKALTDAEDVSTVLEEINSLSHLLHPNKELREKYMSIGTQMGIAQEAMTDDKGRPLWKKILAQFKAAMLKREEMAALVKDGDALKASTNELHEATPSGVSKALVYWAEAVPPPAAPEEVPEDPPAAEA